MLPKTAISDEEPQKKPEARKRPAVKVTPKTSRSIAGEYEYKYEQYMEDGYDVSLYVSLSVKKKTNDKYAINLSYGTAHRGGPCLDYVATASLNDNAMSIKGKNGGLLKINFDDKGARVIANDFADFDECRRGGKDSGDFNEYLKKDQIISSGFVVVLHT